MIDLLSNCLPRLLLLGSGMMAGVFFIFSNTIMRALDNVPGGHGLSGMQQINRIIINPLFLGLFMGTALVALLLILLRMGWGSGLVNGHVFSAACIYLVAGLLVTAVKNVPMNRALERLSVGEVGAERWADYLHRWTFWNHVRGIACFVSAGLCLTGI